MHDNLCFALEREQLCRAANLSQKPAGLMQARYATRIGTLADNRYFRPVVEADDVITKGYVHCCDGGLDRDPDRSYVDDGTFND